jgi:NADH:ubiquinone oxidoreductase subunit H
VEGLFIIPLVLGVAYTTLADRKGLAILQRRLGPETVGLLGVLQPFSDAVKLLVKELVHTEGSKPLLTMALPVITLGCNLGGYAFLPIVVSVLLVDLPLHILATAGLIGLGVHGVLYIA